MVVIVPLSVLGQTPSAILHTQGGVWINNYEAQDSSAVFTGDLLETKAGSSANLTLEGSEVLIQPEAVAKFQGDLLALDHGAVSVGTSRSFKVQMNCVTVVPVANEWTQYEVSDTNGTIQVAARKNDVNVEFTGHKRAAEAAGSERGTVHEGEQKSYNQSDVCGAARPAEAATGLKPVWIALGAAGTGILIWILVHGSGGSAPISAAQP